MKIGKILTVLIVMYGNLALWGAGLCLAGSPCKWIGECTLLVNAAAWKTEACSYCKSIILKNLKEIEGMSMATCDRGWMTKKAARRQKQPLLGQKRLASSSACDSVVAEVERALRCLTLSAPAVQERPFVQWSNPLVFSIPGHKSLIKFFGCLLYSNNYTLLEGKWHNLVCTGKIYISTDRLVRFLYRVGKELKAVATGDIFTCIMADSRIAWLMEKINTLVRNEDIPFTKREVFSADCAEAHARLYLAKSCDGDELEFLTKIIRMNLTPWQNIPRPQILPSFSVDCAIS